MKTLVRRSAVLALIGFVLSPLEVVHALPTPADSVHFCQLIDFEQWRRDHPRPAGKRLALNVGEPRTVRMIYFLPNDRPFRQEVVDSMKVAIRRVQTFYAEQMQAHGYGNRTFRIETDAQGEPLVHRVDGRHPNSYYRNTTARYRWVEELWEVFDVHANIYHMIMDGDSSIGGGPRTGKTGGYAWLNELYIWSSTQGGYAWVAAHELGHLVLHRHHHSARGRNAEREADQFGASFLMPTGSVLANAPRHGRLSQIIEAKRFWDVSAASLTYRMHKVGLLTDWEYRTLFTEISRHGYRRREPNPARGETSQVLAKVFASLRDEGVTMSHVARELNIYPDELSRAVFGLVLTPIIGGGHPDSKPHPEPQLGVI